MSEFVFFSHLDETQVERSQLQSHELWGQGRPLAERLAKLRALLAFGPGNLRLSGLAHNGRLVSSLKRYRLAFHTPLGIMPTLGLGAIFTPETERGRGYAARLVEETLAEAQREGFGAALLFSDIGTGYYARLGFHALPLELAKTRAADLNSPKPSTLRARAALPDDEARLLAWRERQRPRDLRISAYDAATWALFRKRNLEEPARILIQAGEEFGYFSASAGKDSLWVEEVCVPAARLPDAWATIAALAQERKLDAIRGWLRRDQAYAPATAWEPVAQPIPMLKFLAPRFVELESSLGSFHVSSLDYF